MRCFIQNLLIMAVVLILTSMAQGATWHVATTGDDASPGTVEEPFLTIARGVAAAADGDTVLLSDGTYTGAGNRGIDVTDRTLVIRSGSGDPDRCTIDAEWDTTGSGWIFFGDAESSGDFRDDGEKRIIGLTLTRAPVGGISTDYVQLESCVFDSTRTGAYGEVIVTALRCRFRACETGMDTHWANITVEADSCLFEYCGTGARGGDGSEQGRFSGCVFQNNIIGLDPSGSAPEVVDCVFSQNEKGIAGYVFVLEVDRCEFVGNTITAVDTYGWYTVIRSSVFHDNPGLGIYVDTGFQVSNTTLAFNGAGIGFPSNQSSGTISNSLIAFNAGEALHDFGYTSYANCLVYGNGPDLEPDSWTPWVDGNLELDPLFCDPEHGDYHVGGLSPCIDNQGNAVIGALGVGCDDAVATDDIDLLARWTPDGVEVTWMAPRSVFPQGAELIRLEADSGQSATLDSWSAGSFPRSSRYVDETAHPWASYRYVLNGAGSASFETEVDKQSTLPSRSQLTRIYPNPSNPQATIEYVLARDERVTLTIYDLAGRRVFNQNLGIVSAGPRVYRWNGTNNGGQRVAAGSYFVQLKTGTTSNTSRLVIVK